MVAVLRAKLKRLLPPIRLLRPLGGPACLQCCPNRGPAIHTTLVSKLQGCVHRGHSLLALEVELRVCCTRQGPALLRCRNEAIVVLCPLGVSLLTMLRADMGGHQAQWGPLPTPVVEQQVLCSLGTQLPIHSLTPPPFPLPPHTKQLSDVQMPEYHLFNLISQVTGVGVPKQC